MTAQRLLSAFPWWCWFGVALLLGALLMMLPVLIRMARRPDWSPNRTLLTILTAAAVGGCLIFAGVRVSDQPRLGHYADAMRSSQTSAMILTLDDRWQIQSAAMPLLSMGCRWGCGAWRLLQLDPRGCRATCRPYRQQSTLGWLFRKLRGRFRR